MNTEALRFRRMELADVPAVAALDQRSFSLPWPERSFRFEVSQNPAARAWVAETVSEGDTRLAGMLVLWLIMDEAHIATIAVQPDLRRQGIGAALMLEALRSAWLEGARTAFLEVRRGNQAAIRMYEKYGFFVAGVRPRYYRDNNEDALLMTLEDMNALMERTHGS